MSTTVSGYDRYPGWEEWWLVRRFKEAYPHDIPTPGHLQAMAAIVDGLGSPWDIPTNWDRCKWCHTAKGAISFARRHGIATYDSARLTDVVLAAHLHSVRVEIEPCGPQLLRLIFWPRDATETDWSLRHPTIGELIAKAEGMATPHLSTILANATEL